MKKIFTAIALGLSCLAVASCNSKKQTDTTTATTTAKATTTQTPTTTKAPVDLSDVSDSLVVHYKRYDGDYSVYSSLWLWPKDGNGAQYYFDGTDGYGAYAVVPLSKIGAATSIGFIVRTDDWAKDVDSDRFIDLNALTADARGNYSVYLITEDENIYTSAEGAVSYGIRSFTITAGDKDNYVLAFNATTEFDSFEITKNGVSYITSDSVKTDDSVLKETTVSLSYDLGKEMPDFSDQYELTIHFNAEKSISKTVNMSSLFKTTAFKNAYTYTGDLGAIYEKDKTTFRVWSPVSQDIKLRIYETGTPEKFGGSNEYTEYEMTQGEKGTWQYELSGDQEGKYYTYVVTNGTYTNQEIVDPYAKSTGINGIRGMIVDFDSDKAKPEGWDDMEINQIASTSLTVYETHIAELTSSSTWGGTAANAKKYKGFYETGTTYTEGDTTVSTGFDHIAELGVNAVQIVPVFDQDNDEREGYTSFNWGYNPLNYNSLEGCYSSDPYDGYTKIKEFRELVQAYNAKGINIIMDVVYNHVMAADGSNFDVLVPGYYYRYNSSGALSNGSGCGNETASEMPMFRKFMIDSTQFWAETYKLGGFRFDLMGLHDIKTMNDLADNLHENVNEYITVYGEPWTGGTSELSDVDSAKQSSLNWYGDFGQFNDKMRDALIKGGMCGTDEKGWITDTTSASNADASAIAAGILGLTYGYKNETYQTVNYVTCHDNYTLYDRINMANISIKNNTTSWEFTGSQASSCNIWITNPVSKIQYKCSIVDGELVLENINDSTDKITYTKSEAISGKALYQFFGEWTNKADATDKLTIGSSIDEDTIRKQAMLANSVVFTSQGITFMLAGEEFLRTKGLDHNSYMSSYEINELDYSLLIKNKDIFENYKQLIALKHNANILGLSSADCKNVKVNVSSDNAMIYYDLTDATTGKTYRIAHCNGTGKEADHVVDFSGYTLVLDTLNSGAELTADYTMKAYQTIVAVK